MDRKIRKARLVSEDHYQNRLRGKGLPLNSQVKSADFSLQLKRHLQELLFSLVSTAKYRGVEVKV
jgi:hypothetical protein